MDKLMFAGVDESAKDELMLRKPMDVWGEVRL